MGLPRDALPLRAPNWRSADEQRPRPGRHAQGRVHPDVRRQARARGTSAGRTSPAGRSTTSRARRPTRTASTPSQSSGWFGQLIQRSDDGGATWEPVGNKFVYDGVPGTHQWYDGTPHPWEFARVWHLEPSLTDPDTVYAGVAGRGAVPTTDGGQTWHELPGLRDHGSGPHWQPGAGGLCLHTILLDPANPQRMFVAISAAGAFRTDDGGATWKPINRGLKLAGHPGSRRRGRPLRPPHRDAPVAPGRAVHAEALGRHAQRRRRRLVARGERQPADRLRLPDRRPRPRARDDLRRADQERLGALSRPTASCASTAAAPAATSGSRSPRACRSATAT